MRALVIVLLALLSAVCWGADSGSYYVAADVPTDPAPERLLLPWEVSGYHAGTWDPAPVFALAGRPAIDGTHKLDAPGAWLVSFEAPTTLGGALGVPAHPADILRCEVAGSCSPFLCAAGLGLPGSVNVDAFYLDGDDDGDLVVSFDAVVTIGDVTAGPGDLLRLGRTAAGCAGWSALGLAFDRTAVGADLPANVNLIGADATAEGLLLAFDVPIQLDVEVLVPGALARWDGEALAVADSLSGWPKSSLTAALSCEANPGEIFKLTVDKHGAEELLLSWTSSCASGGLDAGIYEGPLRAFDQHAAVDCHDEDGDLQELRTPAAGDRYFLVVPHNLAAEGSYGQDAGGVERAQGAEACAPTQVITDCPS